jgi:hypothetical protein
MKAKAMMTTTMLSILAAASPVLAAGPVREDHSGIVVWAFLGFCALIVIAQLVPATLMMVGLVKGVKEAAENAG